MQGGVVVVLLLPVGGVVVVLLFPAPVQGGGEDGRGGVQGEHQVPSHHPSQRKNPVFEECSRAMTLFKIR